MKRMGRPPTGHKPKVTIRMISEMLKLAKEQAQTQSKTIGTWVEEAIQEKVDREKGESDVPKTDS